MNFDSLHFDDEREEREQAAEEEFQQRQEYAHKLYRMDKLFGAVKTFAPERNFPCQEFLREFVFQNHFKVAGMILK